MKDSIRQSQDRIDRLKRSLTNKIKTSKKGMPKEESKHELQNPLDSGNENFETEFEGGEENDPKPKRKKRRVAKQKKSVPEHGAPKDLNSQIDMCLKIMNKSKRIVEEYNKIFQKVQTSYAPDVSLTAR